MSIDVTHFIKFYESFLGRQTRDQIHPLIAPSLKDKDSLVVGMGYIFDYLDQENPNHICFMPAHQGIRAWPSHKNRSALVYNEVLPLPDQSVDRLILMHSLEFSDHADAMMEDVWRVLKPSGRLVVITPNRRGWWARQENTPLGHGHPYTMTQLSNFLKKHLFSPITLERGLYGLPSTNLWGRLFNSLLNKIGPILYPKFSGVICIEATKLLYAGKAVRRGRFRFAPLKKGLVVNRT